MTRADLIAALEKAEGPSRELDAEIAFELYAKPVGKHPSDGGPTGYLWPEDNPSWSFAHRFPGKDRAWFDKTRKGAEGETLVIERDGAFVLMNYLRVKPYTASLDAALSLVPHGFTWLIGSGATKRNVRPWAHIDGPECGFASEAATTAIALCISALKARE